MTIAETEPKSGEYVDCPFCAERILQRAIKCKHCGETVQAAGQGDPPLHAAAPAPSARASGRQANLKAGLHPSVWLVAALGAIVIAGIGYYMQEDWGPTPSVPLYIAAVVFFFVSPLGWRIGDALRRYAMPEEVWVRGGFWDIIGNKLFWRIGPQLGGMLAVGAALAMAGGMIGACLPRDPHPVSATPSSATPPAATASSPSPAASEAVQNGGSEIIPATELAALADAPSPATPEAVAARVRELCSAQGTPDHLLSASELTEMAQGEVAGFEALQKRNFALTPQDDACLASARITVKVADPPA